MAFDCQEIKNYLLTYLLYIHIGLTQGWKTYVLRTKLWVLRLFFVFKQFLGFNCTKTGHKIMTQKFTIHDTPFPPPHHILAMCTL